MQIDNKLNARVIAFYLPQFHPTPENDEWWGKGFTEWTCIGKAKPLYRGHYQPRIPADLGYYDLRVPETRNAQAEMAKEAGVEGFCYWHYWFGNGKRLLERPFDEVLKSGTPDFPFMLGWANHSWYAKLWDKDTSKDKLLIEQTYPGIEDYKAHFEYVLQAFRDHRYIKDGEKPLFLIFRPFDLPDGFIDCWQQLAKEAGFKDGISFIGVCRFFENSVELLDKGYNYVCTERLGIYYERDFSIPKKIFQHIKAMFTRKPLQCFEYRDFVKSLVVEDEDKKVEYIPSVVPNWDHSPRSGKKSLILHNSTPFYFKEYLDSILNIIKVKPLEKRFLFIKSWNEWGEGNYLEPDLRFGRGYLDALKESLTQEL
ncbi:glycoside hydrolase family 99-like domain-containing protein [Xylanibacter ruminicola]|uniref:glycosyltransferase WbsX family protein n=1 Tax=Xylanibacter ruminicola TaxID=839 RepID=UPI00048F7DF5|nr:glycoside hydrolase family 99-like domain-containing protein [Xylanibacter ruminicola]